ncbi:MAG: hypothetical protein IKF07_01820 [Eubacterium sp.]|nr:hypothetical protein [Eubacterium sp.]
MDRTDIWIESEKEVSRLGVPVKYKGYYYLIIAVVLAFKSGLRKAELCNEIYDRIASMNNVSSQSVEKAIRMSVVRAWKNEEGPMRRLYPGYCKKPTNSEVIAYITSRLRLETTRGI